VSKIASYGADSIRNMLKNFRDMISGTSETPESPGSAFQVPSDRCDPTRFGTIDLDDGQRNASLLLVRAPDAAARFDMLRYASSVALDGYAYNYAVFSIDCTGTITIGPAPGVLMVEATSDFVS
jgi:hypothetical protein